MRIFTDIKIRNGPDANGLYTIQPVPILYGDPSIMVSQLIQGASQNTLLPNPLMSAYIYEIKQSPDRRQAPQYVGKASAIEREFNTQTQTYGNGPGVRQDVERYMPVPYDFTFKLDVWTSNTTTKLQILEQIQMIFNPSLQLQQNSNVMDWTSIFEVWLEDIMWTNRQVGSLQTGDADIRDVMTLKFKIQAWINPPAKLKRSGLVTEIVTRVFDSITDVGNLEAQLSGNYDPFSCVTNPSLQIVTTDGNYKISVAKNPNAAGDIITLLNDNGMVDPTLNWQDLIQLYGQISPGITHIVLKLDPDLDVDTSDILGTIIQDPAHTNILFYTPDIDTLPANTIMPIQSIIDPMEVFPGRGLPVAAVGQRYLLTSPDNDTDEPVIIPGLSTSPWGSALVAYSNDIIEYNGVAWVVIFDAKNSAGKNYVVNNENSSQYVYDSSSGDWTYTYYGTYAPGYWRIGNILQSPCGTTINNFE